MRNSLEIRNKLLEFLSFIIFINTSYCYSKRLRLVKTGFPLNKNSVSGPRILNLSSINNHSALNFAATVGRIFTRSIILLPICSKYYLLLQM